MKCFKKIYVAILTSFVLILVSPAMAALAVGRNPECVHTINASNTTMYYIRTVFHPDGSYSQWYRCHLCGYEDHIDWWP